MGELRTIYICEKKRKSILIACVSDSERERKIDSAEKAGWDKKEKEKREDVLCERRMFERVARFICVYTFLPGSCECACELRKEGGEDERSCLEDEGVASFFLSSFSFCVVGTGVFVWGLCVCV